MAVFVAERMYDNEKSLWIEFDVQMSDGFITSGMLLSHFVSIRLLASIIQHANTIVVPQTLMIYVLACVQ